MKHAKFDQAVKDVVAGLVSSRSSEEGTVITLPNIYPSGSPVVVRVSFDGNTCFVTDMGNAYFESQLLGATSRLISAQVKDIIEEFGVHFDNHHFFALSVEPTKLAGAIRLVGAASNKAVVGVQSKLVEQTDKTLRGDLLSRLVNAYGADSVRKNVPFRGSSSHEWHFAGQIEGKTGLILFDTATGSPNSVFSVHAKFSDVKLVENSPRGVIAVPSFNQIKPDYRNLLQQTANVIEISASNDVFERLRAS
jgi:hypothetical protein